MFNSKITFLVAAVGLAVIGILGQKEKEIPFGGDLTLASLNAYADSESNPETGSGTNPETSGGSGNSTTPPDPWNYVPNHYIEISLKNGKAKCVVDGQITLDSTSVDASVQAGTTYSVSIGIKNCSGKEKGAWCDQRQVGAWVISCDATEQE